MPVDLEALLAPDHTALVLQEVQNGVVGEPSVLPALAEASRRVGLAEHCAELARAAREAGVPVVHCTAATRADRRGANRNARLFLGVDRAEVQLAPGSEAARPLDAVGVEEEDIVLVRHHGLGPMSGTQLDPMLRNMGVRTIVGVGVSVNVAIPNLAFDSVNLGYQVVLARDAIAGVPTEYAEAVIDQTLALVATLTTTAEIAAVWDRSA